jgi:type IV pilus assembly protein PilB
MAFYTEAGGAKKKTFWYGEGCSFCAGTGYLDRVGVYELLSVSDRMKDLIVKGATHNEVRALAISEGMRTLRQEAVRLVQEDTTTISEVIRTIYTL